MSSKLNNFFDHIFCLNLDKRKDRWEDSQVEFKKHNIENVERFSAIDGMALNLPLSNNIDQNGYVHPPHINGINIGAIGCGLSHLFMIKIAKRAGYKNILILEDDVCFHENLNIEFEKAVQNLPNDWDMLYFGGNHFAGKPIHYDDNLYRITCTVTTHAIGINYKMYDNLIDRLINISKPTDCSYADLQKMTNCYVTNPHLAWQKSGYSDVQTSVQGYEFLQSFQAAQC
jgi:GR25 family glycosyltransferase involved in LPS biosynthesis